MTGTVRVGAKRVAGLHRLRAGDQGARRITRGDGVALRPWVSVVVATHNQARFLPRCLESLLAQRLDRDTYEVIVVSDGSTDGTTRVLAGYAQRLLIIERPRREGLAAACNEGVREASGACVVRLDSDDWLDPDALLIESRVMRANPSIEILLPDYWIEEGRRTCRAEPDPGNVFTWLACGAMIRRSALSRVGGYRSLFWEEYDLSLRLLARGARVWHLPVPLLHYRKHASSMTARREARLAGWRELLRRWPEETLRRYGSDPELDAALRERERSERHGTNHRHR